MRMCMAMGDWISIGWRKLNRFLLTFVRLFRIAIASGTAREGQDFILKNDSKLLVEGINFFPGNKIKLNITLLDDALTEPDERFYVVVSSTNQNVTIVNGTATVTIVANDGMLNTKYI